MSTPTQRLLGVEAMRGWAAVIVCLCHATAILGQPKDYARPFLDGFLLPGRAGVDFFFVLSGFIMTHLFLRPGGASPSAAAFARNRVIRIYPPYIVATLLWLALLLVSPSAGRMERDPWYLFESLLLLPVSREPLLGIGWSLRHELIFYAVFAVFILHRMTGSLLFAAWMGVVAFGMVHRMATGEVPFSGVWAELVFRGFNIHFLFGVVAAALVSLRHGVPPRTTAAAGMALFLGLWVAIYLASPPSEWPPVLIGHGLSSALILYGLAKAEAGAGLAVPRPLVTLGAASYALYLTHVPVLLVLTYALRVARPVIEVPLALAFPLVIAGAIAAALAFHRVVERPLVVLAGRMLNPAKPVCTTRIAG
jgi:peptidoglycan/LPS O-acetylase OafA/YrhL